MIIEEFLNWSESQKMSALWADQRSFFSRHKIISVLLLIIIVAALGSVLTKEENIDYVEYNYGDIIAKNNVVEGEKFTLPENINISIDSQDIITSDELKEVNQFNDANNDLSVITISMENNSKEKVSFNSLGFTYVTKEGIQLDDSWGITFNMLPDEFNSIENFGSGDLMPGSKFTRILTIEIPKEDPIKKIKWDYFDIKFTVELPS